MKILYAPWRSKYAEDVSRSKQEETTSDACPFCTQISEDNDEKNGIIKRFANSVIMLNKYPYNAGHVLILPIQHVAEFDQLTPEVRAELMEVMSLSIPTIQKALGAEGMNVGVSFGKAAGAGIPSHLHIHVLPRWIGDTNFMPTIGKTKVISFNITDVYKKLKKAFETY